MAYIRTHALAVWFAGALSLAGCSHDYQLMKTEEQLNGYGAAIRWNLFKRALDYLAAPPHPSPDWKYLDQIKVTGYKPTFRDLYPSGKVATQTVEIKFIPPNSVVEKTIVDEQRWHFDEQRDRWVVDTGLPKFKPPEPPPDPEAQGWNAPAPRWPSGPPPKRSGAPYP